MQNKMDKQSITKYIDTIEKIEESDKNIQNFEVLISNFKPSKIRYVTQDDVDKLEELKKNLENALIEKKKLETDIELLKSIFKKFKEDFGNLPFEVTEGEFKINKYYYIYDDGTIEESAKLK